MFYRLSDRFPLLSVRATRNSSMSKENNRKSGDGAGGGLTYKDAGVDIDAGSELVRRIAKMAPGIGGFGGLFPLGMLSFRFSPSLMALSVLGCELN